MRLRLPPELARFCQIVPSLPFDAVSRTENGRIYFSQKELKKLSSKKANKLVKHEIAHFIFKS